MATSRVDRKNQLMERMKKGMKKGGGGFESTSIFKPDLEDIQFWNPGEGAHFFDIIPYNAGPNDPDADEGDPTYVFQPYMHRNVGPNDRNVICLAKTYDKPCAICDYVKELIREGADEDLISDLKVQTNPRAIYNVHVLDNKEEQKKGVQIFHTSHYIMEMTLLELASSPMNPNTQEPDTYTLFFSEDETGKTISFNRKGTGVNTRFIAHNFRDRDYAISAKLLKQAHTLDQLIYIPTYEEQRAWLTGEDKVEEEEVEQVEKTTSAPEKKTSLKKEKSLREELGEMNRAKLKKYIRDNDLDVSVKPKMDEDDIVEAILEEVKEDSKSSSKDTGKSSEDNECPAGFVFGKDLDEHDECDNCPEDIWKACAKRSEELMED